MRQLFSIVLLLCASALSLLPAQEKNNMDKIRVQPNELATKIGSAVQWETQFSAAMEKAKGTGKPIFWYVPTLPNSFMDRKIVVDRYMLAGPFSWPELTTTINASFVPLRAVPTRQEQEQFKLLPYQFVEPGFLIIQPNAEVKFRIDRMTTFTVPWFESLLERSGAELTRVEKPESVRQLYQQLRTGDYQADKLALPEQGSPFAAEQLLLAGMVKFRAGEHEAAKAIWQRAAKAQPEHPLAWKAAAEAQGIGPFFRGFEIHRGLPVETLNAGIDSVGSAAPKGVYTRDEIWKRSTEFLLGMQRTDGGWVDSDYDYGGTDSLPNVHVAVTSLCGMALLKARERENVPANMDERIQKAFEFVCNEKNLNRIDRDEILWAFSFKLRFLCRLKNAGFTIGDQLQKSVEDLQNVQLKRGHWYHEYPNSWVTATALCSLREAADSGADVDADIIEKGCKALANDRYGNGAYGYNPRKKDAAPTAGNNESIIAAAGRMPLCDLGLHYWGKLDEAELENALAASFEHHKTLASALKYDNHTSTYAYGGFFFWYDMRSRSEAISAIDNEELRAKLFAQQRELILGIVELDGCFVDSHELGRCYGTAMALLCLGRE